MSDQASGMYSGSSSPVPPEGSANAAAYLIVTRADRFEAAARALAIPLAAQPVRRTT